MEAPRGPETGRRSVDEARSLEQEREKAEEDKTLSFVEDFHDPA